MEDIDKIRLIVRSLANNIDRVVDDCIYVDPKKVEFYFKMIAPGEDYKDCLEETANYGEEVVITPFLYTYAGISQDYKRESCKFNTRYLNSTILTGPNRVPYFFIKAKMAGATIKEAMINWLGDY